MKILYINSNKPDYLSDCVYHGLYRLFGDDVTFSHDYDLMYKDNDVVEKYGKGFTIWGNLEKKFYNNFDVIDKIKQKYFKFIIYGSIDRHDDYIEIVKSYYRPNEIAFLDGEDHTYITERHYQSNILYFKRELIDKRVNLLPISFSIPLEKITFERKKKEKKLAHIIPGNLETYIYNNEKDYYDDYKISYFGITQKKGGWDCMRHYEILANYCMPYFTNIKQCPENIMVNLPKKEILESKKLFESEKLNSELYFELLESAFEKTKNSLTTVSSVKYIIDSLLNYK